MHVSDRKYEERESALFVYLASMQMQVYCTRPQRFFLLLFQRFESLVLSKLKWDILSVTPQDFLRHILHRLNIETLGFNYEMVNSHAKTLIALCARGKPEYISHIPP